MSNDNLLERAKEYREAMRDNPDMPFAWEIIDELIAEVERLRSEDKPCMCENFVELRDNLRAEIAAKDARIKELEAMIKQLGRLAFMHDVPIDQIIAHFVAWGQSNYDYTTRLEAAFLKARQCPTCKGEGTIHPIGPPIDSICPKCLGDPESMAREALERMRAGGKDED